MTVGICGYGVYIPRLRIRAEEIARIWGGDGEKIKKGLLIEEKAVADFDEDTATIATEAARNALKMAGIEPAAVGAIYVGSESHPYAVKPTATIVAEAIEAAPVMTAADYEFACKAGTAAIQTCMGLVGSGMIEYGLAIGADTAQGAPGDALEYTAASGGAAYLIGKKGLIAEIEDTYSVTTDTPDFWRREGEPYPRHGGRFTGSPAYFKHVLSATLGLMKKIGAAPEDFDHAVFHQPNGKFPRNAAKNLGFTDRQLKEGILVDRIGNTYSGSSLLGLARVLDVAKPGERILVTAFGSGAGSDSFSIRVTEEIEKRRGRAPAVETYISDRRYIDYGTYVKLRRKIKVAE
ncbi:MAG: hydroxymethylglutaryl-CoA synthase [Methanobacteriota archaeon]|nr:MAG: hydroxymethylglutaryl-CoA synthase [Euryarchaeota archaeon]